MEEAGGSSGFMNKSESSLNKLTGNCGEHYYTMSDRDLKLEKYSWLALLFSWSNAVAKERESNCHLFTENTVVSSSVSLSYRLMMCKTASLSVLCVGCALEK